MDDIRNRLTRDFPELGIHQLSQLGVGEDNIAVLVNNEIAFRIPKRPPKNPERRLRRTQAETKLLRLIHNKLPVATPEPVFISDELDYFGYRLLQGNPLVDQPSSYWTEQHVDAFIELFVEATTTLSRLLPTDKAKELGLEDFHDTPNRIQNATIAQESSLLPSDILEVAEYTLQWFPKRWGQALERGSIAMHGDLGLTNWLVSNSGDISALIDWSDACIAPVEHQLSYWIWESPENVEKFISHYTKVTRTQPDIELMYLDKFLGTLADIGEKITTSDDAEITPEIERIRRWNKGFSHYRLSR